MNLQKLFVKTAIVAMTMLLAIPFVGRAGNAMSLLGGDYTVSINADGITVSSVSFEITKQTSVAFSYSKEVGNIVIDKVNVSKQNAEMDEILQAVFSGTGITWAVKDNMIGLYLEEKASTTPAKAANVANADPQAAQKTNLVNVTGKILDSANQPIPFASVYVANNTAYYSTSNADGLFSIDVPAGSTIIFSTLG